MPKTLSPRALELKKTVEDRKVAASVAHYGAQPPGQLTITIVLDIDTDYLKAVGVNGDTAAALIAENVASLLAHEDYGSTIENGVLTATYASRGEISLLHTWNK